MKTDKTKMRKALMEALKPIDPEISTEELKESTDAIMEMELETETREEADVILEMYGFTERERCAILDAIFTVYRKEMEQ